MNKVFWVLLAGLWVIGLSCLATPKTDVAASLEPQTTAQGTGQVGLHNQSSQSSVTQGDGGTIVIADPSNWGWGKGGLWHDLIPPTLLAALGGGMTLRSARLTRACRRMAVAVEEVGTTSPLAVKDIKNQIRVAGLQTDLDVIGTSPTGLFVRRDAVGKLIHKAAKYAEKVVKNGTKESSTRKHGIG